MRHVVRWRQQVLLSIVRMLYDVNPQKHCHHASIELENKD